MMRSVFLPLMKSPLPYEGRYGRKEWQDWYRALVRVAQHMGDDDTATVVVASEFQACGFQAEADLYAEELQKLGVSKERIHIIRRGDETVSHLVEARSYADARGDELVVVSTWVHAPRVWWITRKTSVRREVVFGIPRPKELVTDVVLTFLFPVLDVFGYRQKFLEVVRSRRGKGIL